MQQKPRQSAHSQHPYFQRDHLVIKLSDLLPDPHLSFSAMLRILSHLVLSRPALWFSSHRSACPPASHYVTSLVPMHGRCSWGLCSEPLPPTPNFFLHHRTYWSYANCEPETVDPHRCEWDAGDSSEGWFQWLSGTWMSVVLNVWPLWGLYPRTILCTLVAQYCHMKVFAYVWFVIHIPWHITGSNLEEWMNEWHSARTSQTGFRGVSWVYLVPVGWN